MRLRLPLLTAVAAAILCVPAAHGTLTTAIFTLAGSAGHGFTGDGKPATSASLDGPAGLVVAADGGILVADTINQRIRLIDPAGRIRTIAGNGKRGFSGDGGAATAASLQDPTALALGKDGSVFVADTGNNRIRVIRADGKIATLAGTADQGFSGDGGRASAAQVDGPAGVAVAPDGSLYFSDTGNNRVRVIDTNGTIATVAAGLNAPGGLAVTTDGSLLIADSGNNRVRRIAPDGVISTVAGTGGGGSGGDGGAATAAQLNLPVDVAAIPSGGFLIAEQGGHRIRRVDSSGQIAPLAGTGGPRYGGDGLPAASGLLNAPRAVELMPSGAEVLVADTDNNRVRYIAIPGQATRLAFAPTTGTVTMNLEKRTIGTQKHKRRILVVSAKAIAFRITKESDLVVAISTKKGRKVGRLAVGRPGAGLTAWHLPRALRTGKRRLKKDHYVLSMTATAGSESATHSMELIVK
jgi:DNA-binding beta-propeller fold protein YncE